MIDKNLNLENLQLLAIGSVIGIFTLLVTRFVVRYFTDKEKYRVSIWSIVAFSIGAFIGILFTSLLIQSSFIIRTVDRNGEYVYKSTIEWFDVMIPMLLISFITIIFSVVEKNRTLYKYWSGDHPIIDVKQRRINRKQSE